MASEPAIEQHANPASLGVVAFTAASSGRRLDLVIPDGEGIGYVAREIFNEQCYKPVAGLSPPRAVLDIGANVGLAAAYFRLIYPEALIHCVEPDPVAYGFLSANAARIGNCRVHEAGLYDGDCERSFYAAPNSVLSSLTRNPIAHATPRVLALRDAGRFVSGLGVAGFDVIKIDTEGAEVPILRSLARIIPGTAVLHLEFHSRDDRRAIDDLMNPTHCLVRGAIESAHRGHFTYVANALLTHATAEPPLSLDD
jgi:FkbM family methyltransferase